MIDVTRMLGSRNVLILITITKVESSNAIIINVNDY